MAQQVLEGTWEEIAAHADELTGKRLKLIIEPDASESGGPTFGGPPNVGAPNENVGPPNENVGPPNEKALAALALIAERQKCLRETLGDGVEIIRYGRSGPMYGMDYVDDLWIQPDDDERTE